MGTIAPDIALAIASSSGVRALEIMGAPYRRAHADGSLFEHGIKYEKRRRGGSRFRMRIVKILCAAIRNGNLFRASMLHHLWRLLPQVHVPKSATSMRAGRDHALFEAVTTNAHSDTTEAQHEC